MGGRGASLRPAGGTDSLLRFQNNALGDIVPDRGGLKQAIGKKGKPYSIDNALKNVNPFYNREYSEFSANCQRCVVAYELRRRGYNVTALPVYKDDRLPVVNSFGNGIWQGAFKGAKNVRVGATTPRKVQSNLEAKMKSYGNGARAIVRIPGHVFNCENVNGKIRYVDAQIGKRYTSNDVFGRLTKEQLKTVRIIRTDNLKISDRARKSVKLLKE
jgi:hypothetical protein